MNSMLQALYLLPKFREVVYQIPSDADDRGAKIGFALQRVFYALQTGSRGVSTKQLTSSFGWGSIENFVQHDVQEVSETEGAAWPPRRSLGAGQGQAPRTAAQVNYLISHFFFDFLFFAMCVRACSSAACCWTRWTRRRRRLPWPV